MRNNEITAPSQKKVNNSMRKNKTEQNHKITNTLPKKVNNSKCTNKTEQNQIIKLNKKLINQLGGDCGTPGCTDGDLGNLAGRFLDIGVDTVKLMIDTVEAGKWMIVDMPQELVGDIENPSVNTPLSNII